MRICFRLLVLLLLCNSSTSLSAYTNPAPNADDLLEAVHTHLKTSKNTAVLEVFNQFKQAYVQYSELEQQAIVASMDEMLTLKMTASPYFEVYLKGLDALTKKNLQNQSILDWHASLQGLLGQIQGRKFKPFQNYLDFSYHFFEKNTLRYSKAGVNWLIESDAFQLVFEDNMPKVKFEEIDLKAQRKDKSIAVEKTSGSFSPILNKWEGKGGLVTWSRHDIEGVACQLADYSIDAKKSEFRAEKVQMQNEAYFGAKTLAGTLHDKLVVDNSKNYPKFDSYDKNIVLTGITAGLKYTGGFAMYGVKIYGKGDETNDAVMELYNDEKQLIMRGVGEAFMINDQQRVNGEDIRTTIYFDQDSIYHPSANIKYTFDSKELNIFKGKKGQGDTPFYSSYHQMALQTDNVDWVITADSILIGRKLNGFVGNNKRVSFQSLGYFDESEYLRLQNGADRHPLATLLRLSHETGSSVVTAQQYATSLHEGFTLDNIHSMLYDLVRKDFILYDKKTKLITVKDKVEHYVKAYHKKADYDNMKMTSESKNTHAVIHIKQKNMLANGIKNLEVSEQQKVALKPLGGQVLMGKDRNMTFDGKVFAGFGSFIGKDYHFDYQKNTITADSVRYFDLFLPEESDIPMEQRQANSIASRIENTKGILLIDAPSNKSGTESIDGFPSFKTQDKAYVYYDKVETYNKIYRRDSFFFELNKFTLNDLDELQREDLDFAGTFVSFDIFPDFQERISVREADYSLGFEHQTPANGYGIYQEKANYKGSIDLSNAGLQGKGTIQYRWASINSEDLVFKPKQMTGSARRFDLKEDRAAQVPQVLGEDVLINWKPYQDSMYINSQSNAFDLFKANSHKLEGTLVLTPDGLKGKGIFAWEQGILTSKLFSFGSFSTQADTTNLSIKAFKTEALAFDTKNVSADIDFDKKIGVFEANSEDSNTLMPYNKYTTNLGDFTWDMKAETITFKGEEKGIFTSVHAEQDSLSFEGETALYDFKNSYLKIGGITHIESADAIIYTKDGKATIKPGGVMETLRNAQIIANSTNKNHVINRATVTIKGKKEYTAKGFYEYNIGDKKQEIAFDNIVGMPVGKGKRSNKKVVTRGTGEVAASDNFFIDKKTKFQGTISLDAESKNLSFDGFAQLDSPHIPNDNWFSIKSDAEKENLIIAYTSPKNAQGEPLGTGLYLSRTTMDIYPTLMTPLHSIKDRVLLPAAGVFRYDAEQDAFLFGDSAKIVLGAKKGNLWSLSNADGTLKGEGSFNIGPPLEGVQVKAAGFTQTHFATAADSTNTDKMTFQLLAGINMPIPSKLLTILQADIAASSFDAPDINYTQPKEYSSTLAEFVSKPADISNTVATMLSYRDLKLPAHDNQFNFLFSELPMQWDTDYQALFSTTKKLGLVSINGQYVSKQVESYIEFKMPSNDEDDRVHIYIKSPSGAHYFFSYQQGILSINSDNTKFNEALIGLKKKELFVKIKDESYEIQQVDAGSAERFMRRVQAVQGD